MEVKINLNEKVKFKLSERGKEIYRHRYDGYGFEYEREPKLDDDGYMSMQLWMFMQIFGEHMTMGMSEVVQPLEIIYEIDRMEQDVVESAMTKDCISRQDVIEEIALHDPTNGTEPYFSGHEIIDIINALPPVEDMGEVSDGYHTFNQLYHQRAVLFATIVNQNKDKAWKSWKHEDGEFCFDKGGEWFIVGVDTPEGSYTYHYEQKYWDMFDCEELDRGKHWDGHTEEDVTRLLSLPQVEPKPATDDCISWQAAIEEIKNATTITGWNKYASQEEIVDDVERQLRRLFVGAIESLIGKDNGNSN